MPYIVLTTVLVPPVCCDFCEVERGGEENGFRALSFEFKPRGCHTVAVGPGELGNISIYQLLCG